MLPERDHNNPPEVLELASGVISAISEWMADNPVIETEELARDMKPYIDRARHCVKDLEAERKAKTKPLEDQVAEVNASYRATRGMLGKLLSEMLRRGEEYVKAEEARRTIIAMEAAAKAAELAEIAQAAELAEREKLDDAAKGEVDVNVAEVISKTIEAVEEYGKAARQAALAQREIEVKLRGGFGRAIGLKDKETLHIESLVIALSCIGQTPDIEEAVLKSARAYRKLHGKLPDGISATVEKHL